MIDDMQQVRLPLVGNLEFFAKKHLFSHRSYKQDVEDKNYQGKKCYEEQKWIQSFSGDGEEIGVASQYRAYYIGWTPNGEVFDSSFDGESLKVPFDTSQATPIEGWRDGVVGMKVGGVRSMTLPSDLAYGETGSGEAIPPNTPIKFIVKIIETVEQ